MINHMELNGVWISTNCCFTLQFAILTYWNIIFIQILWEILLNFDKKAYQYISYFWIIINIIILKSILYLALCCHIKMSPSLMATNDQIIFLFLQIYVVLVCLHPWNFLSYPCHMHLGNSYFHFSDALMICQDFP